MTGFQSKKAMAMGKVKDQTYDIQEMFIEGYGPVSISATLGVPLEQVYAILKTFGVNGADILEEEYSPYNGA